MENFCPLTQLFAGWYYRGMGRLRDAWRCLLGRGEARQHYLKQSARIQAEWLEILLHIEKGMEALESVIQRHRKWVERAEKAKAKSGDLLTSEQPPTLQTPAFHSTGERKAALRQRLRDRELRNRLGVGATGPVATEAATPPSSGNGNRKRKAAKNEPGDQG